MKPIFFCQLLTATCLLLEQKIKAEVTVPRTQEWSLGSHGKTMATYLGSEAGQVYFQRRDGLVIRMSTQDLSAEIKKQLEVLSSVERGLPTDPKIAQTAVQIDLAVQKVLKEKGQEMNALAEDSVFLRRIYLDLAGRIPTQEEYQQFMQDSSPSKRARLIDQLLEGKGFSLHLFNYFADMLRLAERAQKSSFYRYEEWLKTELKKNTSWDKIVYQMMTADGKMLEVGPAGYLLRDRGMRLDNLSLTLSNFLGANVSCAQCHDHPFADWTQHDFYQMGAFFGATETYTPKRQAGAKLNVKTLRDELTKQQYGLMRRILDVNLLEVRDETKSDLKLPEDYKYDDAKPNSFVRPSLIQWSPKDNELPCYQKAQAALKSAETTNDAGLREVFATWMTSKDNPRFSMSIANRLWKLYFGVAVKEPVTDLDEIESAANPELLILLSQVMKNVNFDLKQYVRVLCNTQTYQAEAYRGEVDLSKPYYFNGPLLRRMSAAQSWDSCITLAIGNKVDQFEKKIADKYEKMMAVNVKELTQETLMVKLNELSGLDKPYKMMLAKNNNNIKKLGKNMEEMKDSNLMGEDLNAPIQLKGLTLARASELKQPEQESHFLRMFGQSDRMISDSESKEGSVPQVMMLMNGTTQQLLTRPDCPLQQKIRSIEGAENQINSIYQSFLARDPTADEKNASLEQMKKGMSLSDLIWVLFNSREYIFIQ